MFENPAWLILALVVFFLLLPSRWDPAIWLKEFNLRWAQKLKEKHRNRLR